MRDRVPDLKLEVVVLPVSDVDRAKGFYEGLGWRLDADFATGPDFRVVQLTVSDIDAARDQLIAGGADVSEVFHDEGGVFHHADDEARASGPAEDHADYGSFASFSDPDGNGWMLQEINTRLPGRVTGATFGSPAELKLALERAKDAHTEHEQRTGEADADWPAWYAEYMVKEQTGEELPT